MEKINLDRHEADAQGASWHEVTVEEPLSTLQSPYWDGVEGEMCNMI